jgi:undecaprenyl-diphosphatase
MVGGLAQAIWIGALYAVTTFLPISRGGHLALADFLFDSGETAAPLLMAYLLGTFGATLVLMRRSVGALGIGLLRALRRPSTLRNSAAGRDLTTIALAQIAVVATWLVIGDAEQKLNAQPMAAAIGFFLTALILISTAWVTRSDRLDPTLAQSVLLGFGQALAAFPGLSMSGCTIAMAMWFGLTTRRSFELAMLVSLPAMVMVLIRMRGQLAHSEIPLTTVLTGMAVTLLVGILAGSLLRSAVVRGRTAWFSMWVAPLAIATFAFARAWPAR